MFNFCLSLKDICFIQAVWRNAGRFVRSRFSVLIDMASLLRSFHRWFLCTDDVMVLFDQSIYGWLKSPLIQIGLSLNVPHKKISDLLFTRNGVLKLLAGLDPVKAIAPDKINV